MSDQQVIQDIERVQERITRLRGRIGKHWMEVEKLPSQTATQAWNSLGDVALGLRAVGGAGKRHWLLGLLAAGAGWYFSQPGSVRGVWRIIYPYIRMWKQTSEPSSEAPPE